MLDQRPCFGGDFRHTGDAAARRARVGIDAGEPGNKSATKEIKLRGAVPRDCRIGVGRL
jgi:hypothetical protein